LISLKKYLGSELKHQECMRKAVHPHLGNWFQLISSMPLETTVSWKEPLCFWYTERQNCWTETQGTYETV